MEGQGASRMPHPIRIAAIDESLYSVRPLVVLLAQDREWMRALAGDLTATIVSTLPELADDHEVEELTLASTEAVLWLFVEAVNGGVAPQDLELPAPTLAYAHELVRRGIPLVTLVRSFSVANPTFVERWIRLVNDNVSDPSERSMAVEAGVQLTFSIVQSLTHKLVHQYEVERERWVRSAAAVRLGAVRALLGGEPIETEPMSARLGYALHRHHLAFVVWPAVEGAEEPGSIERVAVDLASQGPGGILVTPFAGQLVAGWMGSTTPIDETIIAAAPATGAHVAVGTCCSGVNGFRRSHEEAIHAYRLVSHTTGHAGTLTHYRDVALAALASTDRAHARNFVTAEIGRLAGGDEHAVRLATTLQVYLEERSSPRRTAQRLGLHENTIVNRIHAAEEMLGRAVDSRVPELLVALRLAPVIRGDSIAEGGVKHPRA